jgi:hypothetical protein
MSRMVKDSAELYPCVYCKSPTGNPEEPKLQGLYPSDKKVRELAKLAAQQGKQLLELEARIRDSAQRDPAETPTDAKTPGPTPTVGGEARPEAI